MDALFEALREENFRTTYLLWGFALMIFPMVGLAWWYHTTIRKTPGGQALMTRQNQIGAPLGRDPIGAQKNLVEAAKMARDIQNGKYGAAVRTMQNRVYWLTGLWVIAVLVHFGILLWADEVNRLPAAP